MHRTGFAEALERQLSFPPEFAPPVPSLADGNFVVPRPQTDLPFTGERMTMAMDGQIAFEHLHRYCLARDLCAGKDVLDVASGEGYGSALLAGVARSVTGVEIDEAAVNHARRAYGAPNLAFLAGDAHRLPLSDGSVDVVTCFETLEHLRDQRQFLAELRRVMRRGAVLLISTPDRLVYSAPGQPVNPFHVLELAPAEFSALLEEFFAYTRLLRQRSQLGSVITPLDPATPGWRTYDRRTQGVIEAMPGLSRAFYLIGVASNEKLPAVCGSIYCDHRSVDGIISAAEALPGVQAAARASQARLEADLAQARQELRTLQDQTTAALGAKAAALRDLRDELGAQIAAAKAELREVKAEAEEERAQALQEREMLEDALAARSAELDDIRIAAASAQEQLQLTRHALDATRLEAEGAREALETSRRWAMALESSTWWRAGAPIRAAADRLPRIKRQGRRMAKLGYRIATGQVLRQLDRHSAVRQPGPGAAPERCGGRNLGEPVASAPSVPAPAIDLRGELGLPPVIEAIPAPASIALPTDLKDPVVSIIIPCFGHADYTLRCLASIAAAPPRVPFEVLVVDDASGDPAVRGLEFVRGLRVAIRDRNRGFLLSCNGAAKLVRGEYLMFLNNDTEVMPGAIDQLHDLLTQRHDAGLVGARLLYPSGVQQEAGGILWRDGSAWNYGRDDDPRRPEYSYVREADYISGAAIMLPRAVWDELGGFDEHFAPAYCEDSDLAFRLRAAAGLKVLYHPEAIVIHHEGVSHGRDVAAGIKTHQPGNMTKFTERWRPVLRREHSPPGLRIMRARDRSMNRKVTLVIDHYVPEPDRDAGSRSMLAFIEALLAADRVVKFFPANLNATPGYTQALQRRGVEVLYRPWCGGFAEWIAAHGQDIDEVLIARPEVARDHLPALQAHCPAPVIFYGMDLHHARMRREPGISGSAEKLRAAEEMERIERMVWRAADIVLYPSEEEVAAVRSLEPGVDARFIPAFALPAASEARVSPAPGANLVFVAGFAHSPNVDAALWLTREIMPIVRAKRPDAKLALVGSNPTPEIRALAGEAVEVTGYVTEEQLAQRYAGARVAVCPLRYGAGIKFKVVEALHQAVPLVTTPTGAQALEGLEQICDVHEDPAALGSAVLRLLDDDEAWKEQSRAQAAYISGRFSAETIRDRLVEAFAAATAAVPVLPRIAPVLRQAA